MAADEEKRDNRIKLVGYIGPKQTKQVSWITDRPVWSSVNDFTCEMSIQDAAKVVNKCPSIFRLVPSEAATLKIRRQLYGREMSEPEPVVKETRFTRQKVVESPRLHGKKGGEPFTSEAGAKSQIPRMAKALNLKPSQLEAVQTVEGWWLQKISQETGETDAELPDDMELTEAEDGI